MNAIKNPFPDQLTDKEYMYAILVGAKLAIGDNKCTIEQFEAHEKLTKLLDEPPQ